MKSIQRISLLIGRARKGIRCTTLDGKGYDMEIRKGLKNLTPGSRSSVMLLFVLDAQVEKELSLLLDLS